MNGSTGSFSGMLKAIYAMLTAIASGGHRMANALNNIGEWAEESTQTFVEKARAERELELMEFRRQLASAQAQQPNAQPVVITQQP